MTFSGHASASISISSRIEDLDKVVAFVEDFGSRVALAASFVNDLNLCLDETLNNIVSHGYDDDNLHTIAISLLLERNELRAEIIDDGRPFDPRQFQKAIAKNDLKSRALGGVGLVFVKSLMDNIDYQRSGHYNRLTLRKTIPK